MYTWPWMTMLEIDETIRSDISEIRALNRSMKCPTPDSIHQREYRQALVV